MKLRWVDLGNSTQPWRIVAAFVIAPLMAAIALALFEPGYGGLTFFDRTYRSTIMYASIGAYPPTVLLGVPAYRVLKSRMRTTAFNCAGTGAAIASLPWLVLVTSLPGPDQAMLDGHVTYQNGVKTWWGWISDLYLVGTIATAGAFAGICFWFIAFAGKTALPEPIRDSH